MSEYDAVKIGKLVLKGDKKSSKRKRKHKKQDTSNQEPVNDEDRICHGGWAKVDAVREMTGPVAIEFGDRTYVTALDNGLFTLGAPHNEGDGPSPEEVLTGISVNETKVAFKSGYGKYLRVDINGAVIGRSDAIGPMEQWEPVFQDGKLALLGCTGMFMSARSEDDAIVAVNRTAGECEMLQVRSPAVTETDKNAGVPIEERGTLSQVEENYVRKFQKFQDKKLRINTNEKTELRKARAEGALHEALLDRRSKMKADRYCK